MARVCSAIVCAYVLVAGAFAHDEKVVSVELGGFNYEIAKRTEDSVNAFLNEAMPPVIQVAATINRQFVSANDFAALRRVLFVAKKASPQLYEMFINFEDGTAIGYIEGGVFADNTQNQTCYAGQVVSSPTERCLKVFVTNAVGEPTYLATSIMKDLVSHPRYQQTRLSGSTWSEIIPIDLMEPGIVYSTLLKNATNHTIGMVQSGMLFAALERYLHTNFALNDRVVFIVTKSLDMVAASVLDVSYEVSFAYNFTRSVPVKAYDCQNEMIRIAGEFLSTLKDLDEMDGTLYVEDNLYIQINKITRTGLEWFVIVVRPVDPVNDFITTTSTTYLGASVICSLATLSSLTLAGWVIRYRKLKLWSYSHPRLLVLLLLCNVLCMAFAFVVIAPLSEKSCKARQFVGALAVTSINCVLLGKALYKFLLDSPFTNASAVLSHSITAVWSAFAVQVLLIVLQASIGTTHVNEYLDPESGELYLRRHCKHTSQNLPFSILLTIVMLAVSLLGFLFTYRARFSSKSSESRGLLFVALQANLLSVGYVSAEQFLVFAHKDFVVVSLLEVMGLVWFVGMNQAVLVVPMVFRQLTAGDLTLAELREMIQKHSTATKLRMTATCAMPVVKGPTS